MADSRALAGAALIGAIAIALLVFPRPGEPPPAGDSVAPVASRTEPTATSSGDEVATAVRVLDGATDPQARANALTSLGRFPGDPAARAALVAAMAPGRPREERLIALAVLANGPDRESLRAFVDDADPTLRDAARAALERK